MHGQDPIIFSHTYRVTHKAAAHLALKFDKKSKCLRIAFSDSTEAVPVWPQDTEPVIVGGKRGVKVPGSGVYVEGDRIVVSGGGASWMSRPPAGVTVPDGCLPDKGEDDVMIVGSVARES